ncbi:FixH family protein [Nitrosophilus kaiyonis]|uniref:FixH family protein n=1 Tax=Nitrosophilus kaiyonis TaxID=2930200 RepID=UPI002490FDF9|nr:FixH family protein [Nitrosophilus kaiyonis]
MTKSKEKNYWPHFIVALVFFAIGLGVWTIKAAIDNPVELDNSYMLNYHAVDEDINDILKKQHIFEKNYDLNLLTNKINVGKNKLEIVLKDKNGKVVKNAKIDILVTRPDTTKYDKKVTAKFENRKYVADVDLEHEGRWNIIIKAKIDDAQGFKTFKLTTLQ